MAALDYIDTCTCRRACALVYVEYVQVLFNTVPSSFSSVCPLAAKRVLDFSFPARLVAAPFSLQVATADVYECLAAGTPDEYCLYLNNWQDEIAEGDGDNLSFQPYRYGQYARMQRASCAFCPFVHPGGELLLLWRIRLSQSRTDDPC